MVKQETYKGINYRVFGRNINIDYKNHPELDFIQTSFYNSERAAKNEIDRAIKDLELKKRR